MDTAPVIYSQQNNSLTPLRRTARDPACRPASCQARPCSPNTPNSGPHRVTSPAKEGPASKRLVSALTLGPAVLALGPPRARSRLPGG